MDRFTALHGAEAATATAASGWRLERITPPSRLFGANGMQFGPDGRLYVAQAMGSQISAIDTRTGHIDPVAANGGPITGPDDVAFDSRGRLYATEVMSARVSRRHPDGRVDFVADGLPSANGITVFNDRLFIDEHRPGGRLFELYPDGDRPPRQIAAELDGPNALAGGPDGKLYFPLVPRGEIWRVDLETGALEKVTDGLSFPTACKFTPAGELLSPQAGNGEVAQIDIATGRWQVIARVRPGIDNLAIDRAGRLFLSHFVDGGVAEVATDGSSRQRELAPPGWVGPWGIACDPAGTALIADGLSLAALDAHGRIERIGSPLGRSAPRFVRAVAPGAGGEILMTTARGDVLRYRRSGGQAPAQAQRLGELKGLCAGPGAQVFAVRADDGAILEIDAAGTARTLVSGLNHPTDVLWVNGVLYVSEAGAGRVLRIRDGAIDTAIGGLGNPRGLASLHDRLYVLDRGRRALLGRPLDGGGDARVIAERLPIGAACPIDFAGGLCSDHRGGLLIAADGEGSVLRLAMV
ncbi:MAG: SMP-30/gluconolactonase/LRE family protein [Pseudomonadota bacterium]|jgi:sugar lactone lactonase YvrE